MSRLQHKWGRWLLLGLALLLLWWSLAAVSAEEVWQVLTQLHPAEIAALIGVNLLILATLCARWWLFLYAQGHRIPFLRLITYRLTAFGISYLTPGPHFGGEPWQIFVVSRRHGVPYADSIAAVTLDKIVEMLVNFTFLAAGVFFVLQQPLSIDINTLWNDSSPTPMLADPSESAALFWQLIAYVLALLAIPLALLIAYRHNHRPISSGMLRAWRLWHRLRLHFRLRARPTPAPAAPAPTVAQRAWFQTISHSETQVSRLCRTQGRILLGAILISAISWCGIVWEFWLMTAMLGLELNLPQSILALMAARLAILLPMPAALGALEAGQTLVMSGLGRAPAAGIGIAILIRARDTILAVAGIWIGGFGLWNLVRGRSPHPTVTTPSSPSASESSTEASVASESSAEAPVASKSV